MTDNYKKTRFPTPKEVQALKCVQVKFAYLRRDGRKEARKEDVVI
jgi:hypothetical protein